MNGELRQDLGNRTELAALSAEQWDLLRMLAVASNSNLVTTGQVDPDVTALARVGLLARCPRQSDSIGRLSVWQVTAAGRSALSARGLFCHDFLESNWPR